MLEIYFLLFYIPRKVRRLAKERGQSALAWSLMAIGAWVGVEIVFLILVLVAMSILPELSRNVFFLLFSYIIPLACSIFASDLVIKRLRKMPIGGDASSFNKGGTPSYYKDEP